MVRGPGDGFGMNRFDELAGFLVRRFEQCLPLGRIERCGGQYRRRDGQPIRNEIFEQSVGERPGGNRSGSGCAKLLVDGRSFGSDGVECLRNDETAVLRTRACDKVNELAPSHRRIVPVARRLAQHCQQTIVETHVRSNPPDAQDKGSTRAFTLR